MLDKGPVTVAGAMSGTSLDGVDAAQIVTDGHQIIAFGPTAYRPYSADEQQILRGALGQWPGPGLVDVAELIETVHAQTLSGFTEAQLIGFHGQTLAHDPANGRTHQCGDGAVLAQVLGVPVIWDFRSSDIEMGGQGAPLAPFYHFALAKWMKADQPVAFLNLGGVGNLTWIDPRQPAPETEGALLAFDTGPANAPLNDLMKDRTGQAYDKDGAMAASGVVDDAIIAQFLRHSFFTVMPPKSLDRDAFANLVAAVEPLATADAAATLTAAIAMSVAQGMQHCPTAPSEVLVTGGGRQNPTLMAMLRDALACPVRTVEEVGLDGDMLEAQAFAYLAVRVARGLPTSCAGTTGVRAAVSGGILSTPDPSLLAV
ncbi:anhydro-N-acetylmuramic acid kinase [Yoonia sp. 208BN28-4]|uniref:anhydro-N-acetylmuramic acid kinase n=1 Tax=Yoonia sp. 208BN28-4 TaxID=3126505 RepID=UPI00309BC6FC